MEPGLIFLRKKAKIRENFTFNFFFSLMMFPLKSASFCRHVGLKDPVGSLGALNSTKQNC